MKKIWNKFSVLVRYYLVSMLSFFIWWSLFYLLDSAFINKLFFTTSFIWHFALISPELREKVLTKQHPLSFINVVVKLNYYLQLFIKINKWTFGPAIVRALSPLTFTLLLLAASGNGNLLFSLLGSIAFEMVHYLMNKKTTLVAPNVEEIPLTIPSAKNSHE